MREGRRLLAFAWPLNILVATAMMSTVAANIPPNRVTSLAMSTIPLAYLLLACGALRVGRSSKIAIPGLTIILLLPLLCAYGYGLQNYFHGEQLLNPGYATPWREVAQVIERGEQPGYDSIILLDEGFPRYYQGRVHILQGDELMGAISEWKADIRVPTGRFWLIARDRGSAAMLDQTEQARAVLLKRGYHEQQVFRIQPRSPWDQKMRTLVLRRPAAEAYVKVYLLSPNRP